MQQLTQVTVPDCVSDVGIFYLSALPLSSFHFYLMKNLTNESLKYIGKMTTLKKLLICGERITDADIVHLSNLNISELEIRNCSVTNDGLAYLSNLRLKKLTIIGCPLISDACVIHFRKMNKLEGIFFIDSAGGKSVSHFISNSRIYNLTVK